MTKFCIATEKKSMKSERIPRNWVVESDKFLLNFFSDTPRISVLEKSEYAVTSLKLNEMPKTN